MIKIKIIDSFFSSKQSIILFNSLDEQNNNASYIIIKSPLLKNQQRASIGANILFTKDYKQTLN